MDGLAGELPLADDSVDLLWCERVLQHVRGRAGRDDDFARVLRPGGRAVLLDSDHATRITAGIPESVEAKMAEAFRIQIANPRAARHIPEQAIRAGLTVDPDIGSAALILPPQTLRREQPGSAERPDGRGQRAVHRRGGRRGGPPGRTPRPRRATRTRRSRCSASCSANRPAEREGRYRVTAVTPVSRRGAVHARDSGRRGRRHRGGRGQCAVVRLRLCRALARRARTRRRPTTTAPVTPPTSATVGPTATATASTAEPEPTPEPTPTPTPTPNPTPTRAGGSAEGR